MTLAFGPWTLDFTQGAGLTADGLRTYGTESVPASPYSLSHFPDITFRTPHSAFGSETTSGVKTREPVTIWGCPLDIFRILCCSIMPCQRGKTSHLAVNWRQQHHEP